MEPRRLLLVEDDPNDVELVKLALKEFRFSDQIDVVSDGEQALHYLLGQPGQAALSVLPRLVLLDLKLPKISGMQVLQALRANPRTRHLVIVVMTSSQEEIDLNSCYDLGINSYIVKPLDFQQFVEVARQVGCYWMFLNRLPSLP